MWYSLWSMPPSWLAWLEVEILNSASQWQDAVQIFFDKERCCREDETFRAIFERGRRVDQRRAVLNLHEYFATCSYNISTFEACLRFSNFPHQLHDSANNSIYFCFWWHRRGRQYFPCFAFSFCGFNNTQLPTPCPQIPKELLTLILNKRNWKRSSTDLWNQVVCSILVLNT